MSARKKTPAAQTAEVPGAQIQSTNESTKQMHSITPAPGAPAGPAACQPDGFIRFHGLTLLVVEAAGVQYVPAKPISDLLGLDWRNQRAAIQAGDNAVLYGACRLISPLFNAFERGDITPLPPAGGQAEVDGHTESTSQSADRRADLYIRLDRAQMFLARVNTSRVRSHGNVDAANFLLKLQIEWAEALHAYELHGVAVKQGTLAERRLLNDLMKSRVLAGPREKPAFDRMISDALAELGYPLAENGQQTLPLEGGAA